MQPSPMQTWQEKARIKVAETNSKIPEKWRLGKDDLVAAKKQRQLAGPFIESFLDGETLEITSHNSVPLLSKITSGHYTALQVTIAFCKRVAIANQINNCLHEIIFDQAIERAKELDEYFKKHASTLGPLHGLPISLKDQFHINGVDTTMGYTSLPQTLLLGETVNNLIGRSLNPVNQLLSCGGSSGGEGALNALRGSSLGTGIGSSVRLPAAYCGIYSIKPTHNRFSYRDAANTNPGQNTYASSVGFLSSSVDALHLRQSLADSTLSRASTDGYSNSNLQLKLGVFWTDGIVGPHPPITRGLQLVVDTLRGVGHKVVNWNPPSQATARRIHLAFLTADGGHDVHKQLNLSGEPLIPKNFQLREPMPLLQYQDLTLEGRDYCAAYSDYWNATADDEDGQIVDAVIMPVAPHAGVMPGKFYHVVYTEAINLLDYSAAVIPVTKADKNVDTFNSEYEPLNEVDRKNWEAYYPEVYHGAPVGVQLVSRKYEEEKVWVIAKIVSAALKAAGVH
ncbi:related to general amidase [Phialocephala subalpina]|uniref:Related to general amidase n=1 Tax=Phialocephala subalpina TaxID=576137 RepID=A0A1L7WFH0_9HELO|nr:related to general amidase [Phialocephala subalpina]